MKEFIAKNLVRIAIGVVAVLIIFSASLSWYNKSVMSNALILKEQSNYVLKEVERTYQNIQLMDISSRGYALIRTPDYLFWTVKMARDRNREIFHRLDSMFVLQGYPEPKYYSQVKEGLDKYTDMYAEMVVHLDAKEDDQYFVLLKKDVGRYFWEVFNPFSKDVNDFETSVNTQAQASYEKAVVRNVVVQTLLILIGIPTLIFVVLTLIKDEKERASLLANVLENNRAYLFHDGQKVKSDAHEILGRSIDDLKKAADFVSEMSRGNYEANWAGIESTDPELNKNTLAGRLLFMRDEMKKVKDDDRKELWATEGLSEFSQIIRKHQHELKELTLQALTYLIKYTGSQQGSLFVHEEDETGNAFLQLSACYAFDRKKFVDKTIQIGQGLVGQTYLEGQTVLLKTIPANYLSITSGLGQASPKCLIIVPLKHNDVTHAILELANFNVFEPYQVAFLEKAGEFIASAISGAQTSEKNKLIMEQMRIQTEQMRAQEEELRQNLEELEATQEQMRRKEVYMRES
ncbi:MAG: GAF domain-containing protein [Chryseolinea sp.]